MEYAPIFYPEAVHGTAPEAEMLARLRADGEGLMARYLAKHTVDGVVFVGRDAAKRMFPEYLADTTGNNRASDAAASALADAVRRTILTGPVQAERNQVVILTGCPASGKTISAGQHSSARVEMEHEMILTDGPRAVELMRQILDAGRMPILRLFYTDDPRIHVRRMISRAQRIGRTVPLRYMARTFVNVPLLVSQLRDLFGEQITLLVTNNSETPELVVHHHRIGRALYHVSRYTEETALEAMHGELDEIEGGPIPIAASILKEARSG